MPPNNNDRFERVLQKIEGAKDFMPANHMENKPYRGLTHAMQTADFFQAGKTKRRIHCQERTEAISA